MGWDEGMENVLIFSSTLLSGESTGIGWHFCTVPSFLLHCILDEYKHRVLTKYLTNSPPVFVCLGLLRSQCFIMQFTVTKKCCIMGKNAFAYINNNFSKVTRNGRKRNHKLKKHIDIFLRELKSPPAREMIVGHAVLPNYHVFNRWRRSC